MLLIKPSFEILTPIDSEIIYRMLELAGRTCYKSEERITEDSAPKFCKMILSRNHVSVIEHVNVTVRFVIDRGVSHELVRHRLASYSQESTRYCDYDKRGITFIIPPWVDIEPGEYTEFEPYAMKYPDVAWYNAMWHSEHHYKSLTNDGWQPQQARSVLPNSLKTEVVTTMNLREWMHVFDLRTHTSAHPQMREIMVPLSQVFAENLPVLFGQYAKTNAT